MDEYELVGIAGRSEEKTGSGGKSGMQAVRGCGRASGTETRLHSEAASVAAVKGMAVKALFCGNQHHCAVNRCICGPDFYEEVKRTALEHGTKVHIASGAVGGFDVLRTVSLMGDAVSGIETRKGRNH